jgi:hypothetical protein
LRQRLELRVVRELNLKSRYDFWIFMLFNLVDRQRVYALCVMKAIQPVEQNPDLLSYNRARFSMNDDIGIKEDSHRGSSAAVGSPASR